MSAKAIGQYEMPFGRDTRVASKCIVLEGAPVPHRKVRFGVGNPSCRDQSAFANSKHLY